MSSGLRPNAAAGQSGAVLIEVIVSAVVLVTALLGLFKVLDVQTRASANGRAASAAANLAETDQERLRSYKVADLAGRNETRTVAVAGTAYTVKSTGDFIRDNPSGTQSCTSSGAQDDYLRITSVVTAPQGGEARTAPVTVRSIVAPPVSRFAAGQGRLSVAVAGGAGQVVPGATVAITGPVNLSAQTNTLGCAVFDSVPEGSYAYKVSVGGYVDPAGNADATGNATVSEGTITQTTVAYDRAGSVTVGFDTQLGSGAAPQADKSRRVSAANAGIPGGGLRIFPDPVTVPSPSFQSTITAGGLYPFTSAYTFYAGSCASANPTTYNSSYFSSRPGSLVVGAGSTPTVTVRVPALRVTVDASKPNVPVHVRARSTDSLCTEVFDWDVTTASSTTATLPNPGLPFGRYNVCNYSKLSGDGFPTTVTNVDLTDPNGSPAFTMAVDTKKSGTGCP